jgi:hypothetical protein
MNLPRVDKFPIAISTLYDLLITQTGEVPNYEKFVNELRNRYIIGEAKIITSEGRGRQMCLLGVK